MKVLFISNDPLLFDPLSAVRNRMRTYAEAIGELHILSRSSEDTDVADGALTLHGRNAHKLTGWRALTRSAQELVLTYEIEVVSAQDPFEYGYIAYKAIQGTNARLHLQVHTDFLSPWFTRSGIFRSPQVVMPLKNVFRRKIAQKILPKASGIRVVSERIKASLIDAYGNSVPVPTVLPIAPKGDIPAPVPLPVPSLPFMLGTVGRLEPEKRIDDVIFAISNIQDTCPAVGLVIIGEGRERKRLEAQVASLGLQNKVFFLGARKDAWGLMRSCQGYIQGSAYEGYGITLIEAALARVPIVTSDVGVVGEVLRGYEEALVSPPGDPINLGYHIIALMEDVAGRELRVRSAEYKAQEHIALYQDLPTKIASDLARVLAV